jgi:hypothetical protein
MSTEYGTYLLKASKDAVIDYPALVDAMNNFSWGRGYGCWKNHHGHLMWCDEIWTNSPNGCPSRVTQWYQRINGELVTVDGVGYKCGYVDDGSEINFNPDECVALEDEEIAKELAVHVKSGWLEIASVSMESVKYMRFTKLRMYAGGRVCYLSSDSGCDSLGRRFATFTDSQI